MTNKKDYAPIKYSCNGATTDFPFGWKILEPQDLVILLENKESKVQSSLEYGKDYDVIYHDTGGNVSTKSVYDSAFDIIIARKTSYYQGSSYSTTSGFQGSEVEKSFDRASVNIQDLSYDLERSLKMPVGSEIRNVTVENPIPGKALIWDDEGKNIVNSDVSVDEIGELAKITRENAAIASEKADIATTAANEAEIFANIAKQAAFYDIKIDKFEAVQGQKDFELSFEIDKVERILSFNINNHNILPDRYTLKNSKTVSLSNDLDAGCEVAITYLAGDLVSTDAVLCNCFIFEQATPASDWNIFHKLGRYPQVSVVDSSGRVVIGEVQYIDEQNVRVSFSGEFAGKAYLV